MLYSTRQFSITIWASFSGVKNLSVQAFIPQLPVEAFAVAVLPRTSRLDVIASPCPTFCQLIAAPSSFATNSVPLSERMFSRTSGTALHLPGKLRKNRSS